MGQIFWTVNSDDGTDIAWHAVAAGDLAFSGGR